MLKKYIIFGSVVLLLAALFTITGCSQATDSDGGGGVAYSENHLFGTANAGDVARAVDSAKRTNRSVVLTDQLVITGDDPSTLYQGQVYQPTVVDFGDLPVRVEGRVTVERLVIVNASKAVLSFREDVDARITVRDQGVFIYNGNSGIEVQDHIYTDDGSQGFKVKYVANPLEAAQGTDERIAIPAYAPGVTQVAPHLTHLYVLDKVTVNTLSPSPQRVFPNPDVIALGTVDLIESNTSAFTSVGVGNNFVFARSAVLTSSAAFPVTIGLPNVAPALPTIAALTQPITVSFPGNTITGFEVNKVEGPQPLTIAAQTINDITIRDVDASGKAVVSGTTLAVSAAILQNAGSVTIGVTTNNAVITIGTPTTANAGTIAIDAGALNGTVRILNNAGTGDISLGSTGTIAAAVNIGTIGGNPPGSKANAGSIKLGAPGIGGPVSAAGNNGTLSFDTATVTGAIDVRRNESTGRVIFSRDVALNGANLLKVPANYGDIEFIGDFVSNGILGDTTGVVTGNKIAGIGRVVFGGTAEFRDATTIESDTVFNRDVTRAAGALALLGDVTLNYDTQIALTTTDTFRIGKRILVGGGVTPVLAGGTLTLTPAAGATLTAGTVLTEDNADGYVFDRTLFLEGGIGFTGNLRVLGNGILSIVTNSGITIPGTSSLTLESDAILALEDNNCGIIFGNGLIRGEATAESQVIASNGAVSFAVNKISGAGSTLAIPEDLGRAVILVDDTTNNVPVEIAGVNIDLSANGDFILDSSGVVTTVTLVASATTPGRITLSEDSLGSTIARVFNNNVIAGTARISGNGVIRADDATGNPGVGDIAAGAGSNVSITVPANGNATLNSGITINL